MRLLKFKTLLIIWLTIFSVTFVSYIIYYNFKMKNKTTVNLTFQYFENCPYSPLMLDNIKSAITGIEDKVQLTEVLINTNELAQRYKFRGSPTLLIDEKDLENMIEPLNVSLSCRVYKDGVPSTQFIKERILEIIRNM